MVNIRAGREKPGLMRQHLTCVHAAEAVGAARSTGAAVGSREITFTPGAIAGGEFHFPIGTAGSTTMVFQAILPALLVAGAASTVVIEGGTHNKAAPPFEFLDRALIPMLHRAGARIRATIERPGFYPAGGGRIVMEVDPCARGGAIPLHLIERGAPIGRAATAILSRLPANIARRELEVVCERLGFAPEDTRTLFVPSPVGPGNALIVELNYEHVTEVFSAPGELGKSAEKIARDVTDAARAYIASNAPVGEHLADQLMVPLAVLAGGRYRTGALSSHARTNLDILGAFGVGGRADDDGVVHIVPIRE
jgi:RNA 3'-terminal phosphate cyclase (ATP)